MPSLTLSNVTYKYRNAETPAVFQVSCRFDPGVLYAIIGPSGSGKSTLLSMMAGLDMPTEGDIFFDGKNLREMDLDRYRRESIAMIFQAFQLLPLLTVIENVCYPMELCGVSPKEARKRAKVLLESVGISGGMAVSPQTCREGSSSAWPSQGACRRGQRPCLPTSPQATLMPPIRKTYWKF